MPNNAPFATNQPPFPNVVVGFNQRVECHVATILVTAGVPSVVQTLSSAGITVADTNTGRITVGFPAGGTGATGWVMCSPVNNTAPNTSFATGGGVPLLDSDLTSFVTGTLEVTTKDAAGADADLQTLGTFTLMIYVLKVPTF